MIIDGKALAEQRIKELLVERQEFGELVLSIVVRAEDPVTASFIRIKNRTAALLDVHVEQTKTLASAVAADGVILQLPLPEDEDVDVARNKIPASKDVDVLSDAAFAAFVAGTFPPPPVPRAMMYILNAHQIDPKGKKVVVVGQGRLVGLPAAELFRQKGAEVIIAEKGKTADATRDADIVVLGAGEPGLLKPDMVKDGVIILDAGTSESSGKVVGDADLACAEKASLFTPVPGGIGPLAVVEIFANLLELKRKV